MRRVPILIVAVLAAMVLTAAALRWRASHARANASAVPLPSRGPSPATARATMRREPRVGGSAAPRGLGAGPPPRIEGAGAHGARTLHGDVRRTDRAAGRAPLSTPAVAWTRDVGGPVEAQVATSPDEQTLYVATLGGDLKALARADGAVRWTLALGDRAYATPCVADDGTIYAGSDAKKLVAVSPEGHVRWSLDTDGEADTGPAIAADGTVVFAAGRMVYGATPRGSLEWRFAAKRKVFTAPAIAGDGADWRVFFGSQDHHAYAVTSRGRLAWSADLGADVDGAPAIGDDGAVFFGTDGDEVVRLDAGDGHVVWRADVGGYVRGPLSIARNGDVLAGVYGPAPRMVRLHAADGALAGELDVQGTGARDFGVHGGALEDEAGTLLFGTQDDDVVAVGASGEVAWRFLTGGDVDTPVTLLSDGSVVVAPDDGKVRLLRAARP